MKLILREWILEGMMENGKEWKRILTTPNAKREIAYRKYCAVVPEEYRCFVALRKGRIVEV